MKNKRSIRTRTSLLMFAPLLFGTIAAAAMRPARIHATEPTTGTPLPRRRVNSRAKS